MNSTLPRWLAPFSLGLVLVLSVIPAGAITPRETALHAIGLKTITAIATGNYAYISSIVDPQGIYVGHDGVKHTAATFRDDLTHRTGLYCELFEKGCKTDHNPAYTLGHVFNSGGDPLDADLQFKFDEDKGSLDYNERSGDGIATFSYRFSGGKWLLTDIHYV